MTILAELLIEDVPMLLANAAHGAVGPLDVRTHTALINETGVFFDVLLDGENVTDRCFFADDRAGIVRLYMRNSEGHFFIDPDVDGPATEERSGRVRFVPRAKES